MTAIKPAKDVRPAIKTPQELVHIQHKITLRQYKYWILMLRAYREAYEAGEIIDDKGFHRIAITDLTNWIGYEPVKSELRGDLEAIRKEPIIYNVLGKDGKKMMRGAGFLSEWEISSNWVGFKLPSFLRDCVERLDLKSAIFQALNWSIFNSFTGKYEAIIYKLCKDYIGATRTPYMLLDDFRSYMGVGQDEYTDFKRLNQWVISGPLKRINESEIADISIEAEFKRENRKVVGLWFKVVPRQQTVMDFGSDPAFRFARVDIPITQQKQYLDACSPQLVELSIQRANEYADEQQKQGKEVNLGALYRKAIHEEWGKEFQDKQTLKSAKERLAKEKRETERRQAMDAKRDELREQFLRERATNAIKRLSLDERRAWVERYFVEVGEEKRALFDLEKADFRVPAERVSFLVWLRRNVISAPAPEEFRAWLQAKGVGQQDLGV